MTLLTCINNARLRQGMASVATVIGNPDPGVTQQLALLQDIGDELAERNLWDALDLETTINGDGTTTLFPLPSGWGGMSPGLQLQSTLFPMLLMIRVSDEEIDAMRAYPVMPLQPVWHIIDGKFEFYPAPAAGEVYKYNYYSEFWVSSSGSPVATWTTDADVSLIDEKVLTTGLEWRYLKQKGLDYAEEFRRYEMRLARADGRQDTRREVDMSNKIVTGQNSWPGLIPLYDDSFASDTFGDGFG